MGASDHCAKDGQVSIQAEHPARLLRIVAVVFARRQLVRSALMRIAMPSRCAPRRKPAQIR
jgi:hypothetical protein